MGASPTGRRVSHLLPALPSDHRLVPGSLLPPTIRILRLPMVHQGAGVAVDGMVKIRTQLCHQFLLLKVMVVVIRLTLR
jgi:hypothetical protein